MSVAPSIHVLYVVKRHALTTASVQLYLQMSGYGAATASSNRKTVCKQFKDLRRTGTSLTATIKDKITVVQDTTEFRTTCEGIKGRDRKKKEARMQEKRRTERRISKSTTFTNLNGFFEVHKS